MGRAVKPGLIVGTPIVFCITAAIGLAAGTGFGVAALIGTWSSLMNGWYLGGVFFIPRSSDPWNTPGLKVHPTTAAAQVTTVTTGVGHDVR